MPIGGSLPKEMEYVAHGGGMALSLTPGLLATTTNPSPFAAVTARAQAASGGGPPQEGQGSFAAHLTLTLYGADGAAQRAGRRSSAHRREARRRRRGRDRGTGRAGPRDQRDAAQGRNVRCRRARRRRHGPLRQPQRRGGKFRAASTGEPRRPHRRAGGVVREPAPRWRPGRRARSPQRPARMAERKTSRSRSPTRRASRATRAAPTASCRRGARRRTSRWRP